MSRRAFTSLLGATVLACATARTAPPAKAEPTQPASPPRPRSKARRAEPIGDANAERVALRWEAAVGGYGKAVAIDRGLGRVAVATDSAFRVFDLGSGEPIDSVQGCRPVLRGGLAFERGELVVACTGALERVDGETLEPRPALEIDPSPVTAVHIEFPWVAMGHHDGTIRIYSLEGEPTREIPVPGPPIDVKSLALSPDGKRIAVAWVQGSIWWWDVGSPAEPHRLIRHSHESDTVAFSHSGRLFAEEGEPRTTTLWGFDGEPEPMSTLRQGDWLKRLLFTHDDRWLVRGGSDGLDLAEIAGPRRVVLDATGAVEDAALGEAGATLAAIDRKGRLTVFATE